VQFTPISNGNIINLGFGDLRPDSSIDDKVSSNNGDMIKVLATVVAILNDFTKHHPDKEIAIKGSTPERTRLYARILKTYYHEFSKEFRITSLIDSGNRIERTRFDPSVNIEYFAFLIKRF
jgi:hypothetical protein